METLADDELRGRQLQVFAERGIVEAPQVEEILAGINLLVNAGDYALLRPLRAADREVDLALSDLELRELAEENARRMMRPVYQI